MLLSCLANDFYDHILAERGGSENTVVAYRSTINQLLGFLATQDVEPEFDQISTAVLRKFVVHLKSSGIRNSTVARHIHGVKSFWRYVVETYDLQRDATLPLKTPRVEHRIPDVFSEDECQRLLDASEENHFSLYRTRDRSMVKLMMILGLRRGEVIRLRIGDFDREAGTLKIVDSKNRKSRLLPVPDGVARDLKAWLQTRPSCDHDRLFCSRQGSPLNPRSIYRMMDRLIAVADIEGKNVHPHMLRHTAATMALRNSGDLLATQHLLGHSDPSVTRVYCHLITDDIRRTMTGNPLSGTGHSRETSDFGTPVSEQEQEHLAELDAHLQKTVMEYDAVLASNPDIRDRWRRFWIADWCRHAFPEPSPMSLPDAMSVVWDDQPVQGPSISTLASMKALKELLLDELQGTHLELPSDIGDWLHQIYPRIAPCLLGGSWGTKLTQALRSLENVVLSSGECGMALATAVEGWSAASGDRALSICADLLVTMVISHSSTLPLYRRWPQMNRGAEVQRPPANDGGYLLLARAEHITSMLQAILSVSSPGSQPDSV